MLRLSAGCQGLAEMVCMVENAARARGTPGVREWLAWLVWEVSAGQVCCEELSQDHKVVEIGRDIWRSSGPIPCSSRVSCSRFLRSLTSQILSISKDGDSTTSLGNPFQYSVTLTVTKVFSCVQVAFPCFLICAHCGLSCHWTALRRIWLPFHSLPSDTDSYW